MRQERVRLGIERLLDEKIDVIRGQRVGLVCNQASVMPDTFAHTADVLAARDEFRLTTLFGPQHGIRGDLQDNMIETPHAVDERTGIMVYSLYSETRIPTEEMVRDIDTFVIDLQDVGCRIYTFVYTMANCMRAAKQFGKKVVVCDRPNPINGNAIEGNITEHEFKSFVGQFELPTRHGMTIGELAKMFNEHFGIGCDLEVIEMNGWRREMWGDETGLRSDDVRGPVALDPRTHEMRGRLVLRTLAANGAEAIAPLAFDPTSRSLGKALPRHHGWTMPYQFA